jgi:hypothetical protein
MKKEEELMKKQKLIKGFATLTAMALVSSMASAQVAQTSECLETQLECIDGTAGPMLPIPEIQIGVQLQINCEATDSDGQNYLINFKQIKKIPVAEGHIVNYYLAEGQHGLLQYSVKKIQSTLIEPNLAAGYFFNSKGSQILEVAENQIKIEAHGSRVTRIGTNENDSELVFSDISANTSPDSKFPKLKIFSVVDKSVFFSDFNNTKKESIVNIKFVNSSCTYN